MKQKQVKTIVMILLLFSSSIYLRAAELIPEDALLEFLGEFKSYDDDTLAIALEAPLDAPEDVNTLRPESGSTRGDQREQADND